MDETEVEGSAFGLGEKWKKVKDDIPTILQNDQILIIQKKCKKIKSTKVYAIFKNEHGPQMERLQVISNE
ncbi:MAG: hypothetical protein OEM28_06065 [Nitrosopumilus sp.]|nr:hypothetical protein [Nitrosopumilus sp.]MDH3487504.1 hypothetical protein [Nitrosopumilus sp.]